MLYYVYIMYYLQIYLHEVQLLMQLSSRICFLHAKYQMCLPLTILCNILSYIHNAHSYFCVCLCTFERFSITKDISSKMPLIGSCMTWVNVSMILFLGKIKITLVYFNIVRNKWVYTGKILLINNVDCLSALTSKDILRILPSQTLYMFL